MDSIQCKFVRQMGLQQTGIWSERWHLNVRTVLNNCIHFLSLKQLIMFITTIRLKQIAVDTEQDFSYQSQTMNAGTASQSPKIKTFFTKSKFSIIFYKSSKK